MSTSPSAESRRRIAATLRGLRIDAGFSTTKLAERLGWSQSKVSKSDLGRTLLSVEDVQAWAEATGAAPEVRAELLRAAGDAAVQVTEWRRELAPGRRRKQADIARMEAAASVVRVFSHDVVPGLAQIRAYVAAMFRLGRQVGPADEPDDEVIQARIERQNVLSDPSKQFLLLMSETALRRRLVPADQMRHQLEHLAVLTARDNVTLGVIPFEAAERVHQYHAFAVLGDPERDDEALVLAETLTRGMATRSTTEINEYIDHFNALRETAVEGAALCAWLQEVINDLTR